VWTREGRASDYLRPAHPSTQENGKKVGKQEDKEEQDRKTGANIKLDDNGIFVHILYQSCIFVSTSFLFNYS